VTIEIVRAAVHDQFVAGTHVEVGRGAPMP
jgi:hypothetical protein